MGIWFGRSVSMSMASPGGRRNWRCWAFGTADVGGGWGIAARLASSGGDAERAGACVLGAVLADRAVLVAVPARYAPLSGSSARR